MTVYLKLIISKLWYTLIVFSKLTGARSTVNSYLHEDRFPRGRRAKQEKIGVLFLRIQPCLMQTLRWQNETSFASGKKSHDEHGQAIWFNWKGLNSTSWVIFYATRGWATLPGSYFGYCSIIEVIHHGLIIAVFHLATTPPTGKWAPRRRSCFHLEVFPSSKVLSIFHHAALSRTSIYVKLQQQ